jgi:polyhydroxyalkanoate synthesis repressor PhaR
MNDPVVIKKYPNRRLYHPSERRYLNLADIEAFVLRDVDFRVVDAATGQDLTRRVLAAVALEQMKDVDPVFPADFLRLVIRRQRGATGWQDLLKRFADGAPGPSTEPRATTEPAAPVAAAVPEHAAATTDLGDRLEALRRQVERLEARLPRGRGRKWPARPGGG